MIKKIIKFVLNFFTINKLNKKKYHIKNMFKKDLEIHWIYNQNKQYNLQVFKNYLTKFLLMILKKMIK